MLVYNIPYTHVLYGIQCVWHLKVNHTFGPLPDSAANAPEKFRRAVNMFKDMPAADEIDRMACVYRGISLRDNLDSRAFGIGSSFLMSVTGIETEHPIVAETLKHCQKITLTTAYFDDVFISKLILLYQTIGRVLCMFLKARRKMQ